MSVAQTFIAAVLLQVAMDAPQDASTMNADLILGIATAALRSGVKAVFTLVLGQVKSLVK